MLQSTMRTLVDFSLPGASKKMWEISSAAAALAAVAVAGVTFAVERFGTTPGSLLSAVVVLCGAVVLHARFLFVAEIQNRQATELLWTKECEFQSIFENAFDAILVLDDEGVCRNANPSANIFFPQASTD